MINSAEFKSVPQLLRPRMRWWITLQSDPDQLRHEIHMMKKAGFSGAELSGDNGWHKDGWYDVLHTVMEEACKEDFEIDLMIIGSWTTTWDVFTDVNDPTQGVRMELDAAHIDGITRENPYSGPLPVSKEAVEDSAEVPGGRPVLNAITYARYVDKEKRILSLSSAGVLMIGKDVIKSGDGDTDYTVTFTPEDDGEYVLFAWWLHPDSLMKDNIPQLDFLGKYGTIQLMNAMDKVLFPRIRDVSSCLRSLFIDSIEWITHLDAFVGWQEAFIEQYGYDFTKYLPAVYEEKGRAVFHEVSPDFTFDEQSQQLMNTYTEFLTEMYIRNHIVPMQKFCAERGLTLRYQSAYGKTLEMARTAAYVDYPDTETLYSKDFVDFYRAQTAAVNILNKGMYGIEASAEAPGRGNGDEHSGNYEQGFKKHLWHVQRAYAAGVNQVYFHGLRYRGQYNGPGNINGARPDVHWPGGDTMGFVGGCANSWDERQPNWNEMPRMAAFMGRVHTILSAGRAKVDLAVYHHSYMERLDCCGAEKILDSVALEQAGYSYDFLSPNYLTDEFPALAAGRLFPEGPAYKAIVFNNQTALPGKVVSRLVELANAGFPIVFCGETPRESAFFGEGCACEEMGVLLSSPAVSLCPSPDLLPDHLIARGVVADASYPQGTKVLAHHRLDGDTDYFYFYHYADADTYPDLKGTTRITFPVTLAAEGTPYILDPWTGEILRPAEVSGSTVTLSIAPNDSLVVAVDRSGADIPARRQPVLLMEQAVPVKGWTVDIETWTEGSSPFDTKKEIVRTEQMEDPIPWTQLDGMDKTSGVGYYKAEIEWDKSHMGAILTAANIEDCYSVKVNGTFVPSSQTAACADLGDLLVPGKNTLEIAVSSTLLNACTLYGQEHGIPVGRAEIQGTAHYADCGLWGPVMLIPYEMN